MGVGASAGAAIATGAADAATPSAAGAAGAVFFASASFFCTEECESWREGQCNAKRMALTFEEFFQGLNKVVKLELFH